jgi:hypothetical protein
MRSNITRILVNNLYFLIPLARGEVKVSFSSLNIAFSPEAA